MKFAREVWGLIKPYWKSEERWAARGLLAIIIALNLGEVYLNVLFNEWNNDFYNSFQDNNKAAFFQALIRFSYLATTFIIVAVYRIYLNQMLRIKWRRWMTNDYLSNWLAKQNYYRMQMFGNPADNPDQRISEDIGQFIQLTLDLSLGLLSSVVTLFSFLAILWQLSGALDFALAGMNFHIQGYMVWVALVYAVIGSWLTMRIGKPLVMLNFNQQRYEADFRFSLVRLRENTESVAFYSGEAQEQRIFASRFSFVVDNFWQIMKRQKMLTWFTSGYGQIAIIFPYVVVAPRFFAGSIKLGQVMQTASAFGQVQSALSYIVDAYTTIASWKAIMDRLSGFTQSIHNAGAKYSATNLERFVSDNSIEATMLNITLPNGEPLLKNINIKISTADSLLITGPSGSGKSTLLRTLAGLWPFVEGKLSMPAQAHTLFVPQKSYLPLGTLRQALCYPQALSAINETEQREALSLCGLSHLESKLDEADDWSHILSLGEQQRLAFARILLAKPAFVFMDEATSALDEPSEAKLYTLLKSKLPNLSLVSVGHRHTLRAFHTREQALA